MYGNQTKIAGRDESGTDQRIDARHVAELSASSKLSAVGPSTVIDASGGRESRLISIQQRKISAFPVRLFCTGAEKIVLFLDIVRKKARLDLTHFQNSQIFF